MNIYWEEIERVRIIGPTKERHAAINWAYDNGFRTIRSGPYPKKFPELDTSRFLHIVERRKLGTKKRQQRLKVGDEELCQEEKANT
jgi:hypothetical protein